MPRGGDYNSHGYCCVSFRIIFKESQSVEKMNIAVIFAGGSGIRMGSKTPKQFLKIHDKPVLAWTLELFEHHPEIDIIRIVAQRQYFNQVEDICKSYQITKFCGVYEGGESAQDSIYAGLMACRSAGDADDSIVLLHDGVRPYVKPDVISANIQSVKNKGNGVTFTPCVETLIISKDGKQIDSIPYRRESYAAQAPQSFRLGDIIAAHEKIRCRPNGYIDMVDQATICFTLGIPINLVPGNRGNIKITTPEDIVTLEGLLKDIKYE